MDIVVEIWGGNRLLETYVGYAIYIDHMYKCIRIEQKNGYATKNFVSIECDHTHRHYTVCIGK